MNRTSTYKTSAISTLQPGQMIVLLYYGAIKSLRQAIVELEAGRYMENGQRITQAVDIITELKCSLDLEAGGEIAQNLNKLYDFMIGHLYKANAGKDAQKILDVINLLTYLNNGWRTITA